MTSQQDDAETSRIVISEAAVEAYTKAWLAGPNARHSDAVSAGLAAAAPYLLHRSISDQLVRSYSTGYGNGYEAGEAVGRREGWDDAVEAYGDTT